MEVKMSYLNSEIHVGHQREIYVFSLHFPCFLNREEDVWEGGSSGNSFLDIRTNKKSVPIWGRFICMFCNGDEVREGKDRGCDSIYK